MTYYDELLRICAFDESEIDGQRERIERTFKRLNLGPQDMERAVARVRQNFDIELMGVRKVLGVWLKELFDVVLAREEGKKIVYFGYPPFQYTGLAIKAATKSKNDFYIGCPEVVLCQTLGQIFDKIVPVLEAGEAAGLPPGHAMCSLLQIKLGALEKGLIPVPDMSIATSYFCDMGPKADEFMQYKYGYFVEYLDGCLDAPWGAWPEYDRETVVYLGTHVNKLFGSLHDRFGLEINEDTWQQARLVAGKLYMAINELNQHLTADPVPLSMVDSQLVFNIPTGCTGVAMEEGPKAVEILADEVRKRVNKGIGVVAKGAPRVVIFLQSFIDPVINRLIEDVGLAVPVTVALLPPPKPTEPYPFPTLGEKRAEQAMFNGAYHSTYGWIKRNTGGLNFAEIDGVIWSYPFSCRPIVCTAKLTKLEIEKETGLPTLLLEMDLYDSRNYSAGSLRTRLEAFSEMLKSKKAAA
ncbi:MAG: 2-hydroxyacyl-CoA dehydratase [Syntrophaceae bacterium]|nr:2-hydroxyacyl-CoA dehydratase [Syntrophaceae bacterium]